MILLTSIIIFAGARASWTVKVRTGVLASGAAPAPGDRRYGVFAFFSLDLFFVLFCSSRSRGSRCPSLSASGARAAR